MVKELEWDTDFFGFKIGIIELYNQDIYTKAELSDGVKNYRLVYLCSEYNLGEEFNSFFGEVKISFFKKIYFKTESKSNIVEFDPSKHSYNQLLALCYLSGKYSRFNKDSNFKNNEYLKLYKKWIDKSIDHKNSKVFIKLDKKNIQGFITVDYLNAVKSRIGLIAVSKKFQGLGIGSSLLKHAEYFASKHSKCMQVITQDINEDAKKLYVKNGYKKFQKQYIYHIWNM